MRPSLTINEATALLGACNLAQVSIEQRIEKAAKTNDMQTIANCGVDYAILIMGRRKLEHALQEQTATSRKKVAAPLPETKSE